MKITKEFEIKIEAKPENIWFAMWDDFHYRQWTSVFCQGSYMKTDWTEGSIVHFLNPDGNGMFSRLEKVVENCCMHFVHLGEIKDYKREENSAEVSEWSGSREFYTLENFDGYSVLKVMLDLDEKYADYFMDVFPKGLEKVKELAEKFKIHIAVELPVERQICWDNYHNAENNLKWNSGSPDWHTTNASNDLSVGGKFCYRMEAKDGSAGFDFVGIYTEIVEGKSFRYSMEDGRVVEVNFSELDNQSTRIDIDFDAENMNSPQLQRDGWQMILNNFRKFMMQEL